MKKENFVTVSGRYPVVYLGLFDVDADVRVSLTEGNETIFNVAGPKSLVDRIMISKNGGSMTMVTMDEAPACKVYAQSPEGRMYNDAIINLTVGKDVILTIQKPKGQVEFLGNHSSRVFIS